MHIRDWDERYRLREQAGDFEDAPSHLVSGFAPQLEPGKALDLACGAGRNSAYLAAKGWDVTAVDGSPAALATLKRRSPEVRAVAVDLTMPALVIRPAAWDLILCCYYLQRDLFPAMKAGVRSGGLVIAIVHIPEPGEEPTYKRASPGELRSFFTDWKILHDYEGPPRDPVHKRRVAEVVARAVC